MRLLVAFVLFAHGFAHLVGFVGPWRLSGNVPYKTTVAGGRLDVGDAGIKAVGLLWLLVAVAFAGAAVGEFARASWWPSLTMDISMASLAMCVLGWPEARIGAAVNVVILFVVAVGRQAG